MKEPLWVRTLRSWFNPPTVVMVRRPIESAAWFYSGPRKWGRA